MKPSTLNFNFFNIFSFRYAIANCLRLKGDAARIMFVVPSDPLAWQVAAMLSGMDISQVNWFIKWFIYWFILYIIMVFTTNTVYGSVKKIGTFLPS